MLLKNEFVLALILILLEGVTCKGRLKKLKSIKLQNDSRQYEIYQSDWLPSDVQITAYLYKGIPKKFLYWSPTDRKSLSLILMPCSGIIEWTMVYHNGNTTTPDFSIANYNETTTDISITHLKAIKGLYVLHAVAKEAATYVHMYVSTENEGPQALRSAGQNNLKILGRGKTDWLAVRWEPSLVDPQRTDYCLVINTKKHYETMCSAQLGVYKKKHPSWELKSELSIKTLDDPYPSIQCVGQKTHLKTPNPKQGVFYYFDLFAINKQSNLTYLLDRAYKKFDQDHKFISIRDGKFASLKKMEGKAEFRFKVGRNSGKSLNVCVIPCGSYVYVDIRLKRNIVVPQAKVERFKNITIPKVLKGQRYIVRILAPQEDFINTGVEIFASTRPFLKSPIPTMPGNTTVKEYESLKTCTSVTVGWMPVSGQKSATYCFIVKEGKIKENEGYSQPNQCGLENRLKKSLDFASFALKYCKNIDHKNQDVLTREIKRLNPGKSYIVLVSVKNPKGRSLAYNVLQVNTLNYCNHYKVIE